jgi:predicted kinase
MSYTYVLMIETEGDVRREDVARILDEVRPYASRRKRAALVVLVGLPATGKSRIAQELRSRTGAVVLESDALRRLLFAQRTYSAEESRRLFAAVHLAAERLLADGVSVVVDATNLVEAERVPLYEIAERAGARLVVARVTAPSHIARQRLARREAAGVSLSEAKAEVYERMRLRVDKIRRPHHVVDASRETAPVLAAIVKEMNQS